VTIYPGLYPLDAPTIFSAAIGTGRRSRPLGAWVFLVSDAVTLKARVTQLVVETITPQPTARATQLIVETLTPTPPSPGVVSQIPLETLASEPAPGAVTQIPLEHMTQWDATLVYGWATQIPVEHAWQRPATAVAGQVTQIPVEILYPFGCFDRPCVDSEFPVDDAPAGGSCSIPPLAED